MDALTVLSIWMILNFSFFKRKKREAAENLRFPLSRGLILLRSVAHFPSRDYFLMMLHDDNIVELTSSTSLKLPFKPWLVQLWDEL